MADVPHGRTDIGFWALSDGAARYAARVKDATTTDMTADEIHELGAARGSPASRPSRPRSPGAWASRRWPRWPSTCAATSSSTPGAAAEILERYQKHVDQMYEKLPELFGPCPGAR